MNQSNHPSILISGATGNIGRVISEILLSKGIPFRAMVRPESKGREMLINSPVATLADGDFNDVGSLEKVLIGVEKAFLLSHSTDQAEKQQRNFVEAAKKAGVRHIVKLSQWAADKDSPVRFLRYHANVEQAIVESGMTYTFLRPNLFLQALLGFKQPIQKMNALYAAIGSAQISAIDVRDVAAVAVACLTEDRHEGKTYSLTGPEAVSHTRIAEVLSEELGREIGFYQIKPEQMKEALLSAGFPEWQAEGVLEDYAHYDRGEATAVTQDVRAVTGNTPVSLRQFIRDFKNVFQNE